MHRWSIGGSSRRERKAVTAIRLTFGENFVLRAIRERNPRENRGVGAARGRDPHENRRAGPAGQRNPREKEGGRPAPGRDSRGNSGVGASGAGQPHENGGAGASRGRDPRGNGRAGASRGQDPREDALQPVRRAGWGRATSSSIAPPSGSCTRGIVNENVVPTPTSLSTEMCPPWASTMPLTMYSPSPAPAPRVARSCQ